ncbi:hypothetical protein FISHEDRAFT_27796, partial [Fistulina hepatica ATCC 64428]
MAYTLLSVNRLDKLGFSLHVEDQQSSKSPSEAAHAAVVRVVTISELHQIMGHHDHEELCRMVRQGLVEGVELDPHSKPEPCRPCIEAKAKRHPFAKVSIDRHEKYTAYGDKIVGDLVGP